MSDSCSPTIADKVSLSNPSRTTASMEVCGDTCGFGLVREVAAVDDSTELV